MNARKYSEITASEWIVYRWTEVTSFGDAEAMFIRGYERPLDEAMKLAGGSFADLQQHLIYCGLREAEIEWRRSLVK